MEKQKQMFFFFFACMTKGITRVGREIIPRVALVPPGISTTILKFNTKGKKKKNRERERNQRGRKKPEEYV